MSLRRQLFSKCCVPPKRLDSHLCWATTFQWRKPATNSFLPAMRMRLTWKHFHSPLRWSPGAKNKQTKKTIEKKRQVFKNTYTQSAGGPTHLTWEQIFPRPVPRSHRYRLNHCGRDIAVFETTLEVTSVMLLSTTVIRSFSTADKHTPVPGKPSWKSVLRLMSRLWSGTVRKQVQQSPSPMVTSLLSPRKKKLHCNVWSVLHSRAPRTFPNSQNHACQPPFSLIYVIKLFTENTWNH